MSRYLLLLWATLSLCACARLLGFDDLPKPPFEHRAHVTRGIACVVCHAEVAQASSESAVALPDTERCLSCHSPPHDTRDCRGCHGRADTPRAVEQARRWLRFDHATHVPRLKGNCARCHAGVAQDASPLLPPMATCLSCHGHDDEFDLRRCDRCHVDVAAEGVLPLSHVVHDEGFVHRHGPAAASSADLCSSCHSAADCASCHGATTAALPQRFNFAQPRLAGLHRAGFRSRHAEEARADAGLCVTCHSRASCQDCHRREGVASRDGSGVRNPHPPGWVGLPGTRNRHGGEARRDPLSCASCHGGAGEQLCVDCHRVGGIGGNPHPPDFQSALRRRRDRPCRACHAP